MEDLWNQLATGNITVLTVPVWFVVALILGAAGGAIGGMLVGAAHLGKPLSAMMGSFFGPIGTAPGVLLGLVILALIQD